MEEVILKSRCGYISWTNLSNEEFGGYFKDEFKRLIPCFYEV